ncbi:MAG: DUF2282 domain-containing protein [Alphaproteobacteria bacterium]|nr:DUF2282 domain-containing protein [Alphaproteobacteria bacterium]NCQ67410.1 DUF2282 domain-containing protein [Alphaproteobacteria bacterium]NCT08029.1 DUF2282 domain-containing protein [Alphaproteobacteria bacterium]
MKTANKILLSSAFALAVAGIGNAEAQDGKMMKEKCFGVAKAGKNDCASKGNNSCAGTSTIDGDKAAFVALNKGLCEKLAGGSLEPGVNEDAAEKEDN